MESDAIAVVLNPAAGGGKTLAALPKVNEALQSLGRTYHIYLTKHAGDGRDAACRFAQQGVALVLAVGGDGTMHEVANGICDSGVRTPLGIVPVGNGSDFARTVRASKRIEQAVRHACTTESRPIDVGCASFADGTAQVFINVAGLGFDALVAERAARTKFLPGSNLPYLAAALQTLVGFRNIQVVIDADGDLITTYAVFVQIANARYMGGGYKIAPMADITDGLLDVAIVGDLTKPDLLRTLPTVYSGRHVTHPKFRHFRAKSIRVETMQPARVQLDGELIGTSPVTFSVMPGALMFAG